MDLLISRFLTQLLQVFGYVKFFGQENKTII